MGESLLSRRQLEKSGKLLTDIAGPEIIESTPDEWKRFVRLYFRPRTPTQYRNEGIRPKGSLKLGAHCPVPVIFLFDANNYSWEEKMFRVGKQLKFNLSSLSQPGAYKVSFYLDGHLAYQNSYNDWLDEIF